MTDNNEFKSPEPTPQQPQPLTTAPMPVSRSEEQTLAVIAHLSIFLNLITGFLGLVPPLIIYLAYKDRSKYLAYQSLQALIFQGVFFIGAGLLIGLVWLITGLLSIVVIGLCLIPLALTFSLVPVGSLVYAVVAAVDVSNHRDFKYWFVGDWVRGTYTDTCCQ